MKTVKEVSDLTGISVRTLHYYDEIGLLKPALTNEAGYRFYDDASLEKLQQILYFREFDVPLKEIYTIVNNSALEKKQILEGQRYALQKKKRRLERLISSIDSILKGENKMDFKAFSRDDVEELFQIFIKNLPEEVRRAGIKDFGSLEVWHKNYVEKTYHLYNQPETTQILMEAYGDKENLLESVRHPMGQAGLETYQKEIDGIMKRLVQCKQEGMASDSAEVKLLVCEYAIASKRALKMKNERQIMVGIADTYDKYDQAKEALDEQYGEAGIAKYLSEGIRTLY